ncbi:MAG: hypothetical protein AAGK02_12495 [Pseudomonadota bacterium]
MRTPAIVIGSSLALAACGGPDTSGTFTTEDGETGEYRVDSDSGETTATVETSEGTATLRSGEDVPLDLPDGFSLYPGAKVVSNTVVSRGEGKGSMTIIETSDSIADLKSFYRKQAEDAGVDIGIEADINGGAMLGGESEEGQSFMLMINRDADVTSATLTVGQNLEN